MNYTDEFALREEAQTLMEIIPMNEKQVMRVVTIIALLQDDAEVAHGLEDDLHKAVLQSIDTPLAVLALQTRLLNFSRWCA